MDPLNAEFARLLNQSGWGQSEAAARLRISPAAVSQYLSQETRPSKTTLLAFKLLIGDDGPLPGERENAFPLVNGTPPEWAAGLTDQLRLLPSDVRKRILTYFNGLVSEIPKQEPASSKDSHPPESLMKAIDQAALTVPLPGRAKKAGETSGKEAQPLHGTSRRPKTKRLSRAEVPDESES